VFRVVVVHGVGDGAADDTEALNSAFAQDGAIVFIPPGTYRVSRNLAIPACYSIVGGGRTNTILKPTRAVSELLKLSAATLLVDGFGIDGSDTSLATGIVFGDQSTAERFGGVVRNLQILQFDGIGMRLGDTLASLFEAVRVARCGTGMLVKPFTGGFPTATTFVRCEWSLSPTGPGVEINDGTNLVFDGCIFQSNAREGVRVDTTSGGTAIEINILRCWFEENYGRTISEYQFRSVAHATRGTARGTIRDSHFARPGNPAPPRRLEPRAKSIVLDGATNAGWIIDNAQVPSVHDPGDPPLEQIRIQNGAWGMFMAWPPNLDFARLVSGAEDFPPFGNMGGDWTAKLSCTRGTITLRPDSETCRYVRVGNMVTVTGQIVVASVESPTGVLRLEGLPFAARNGGNKFSAAMSVYAYGFGSNVTHPIVGRLSAGGAAARIDKFEAGEMHPLAGDCKPMVTFCFTLTYFV
jgi:hypothetical protein